MSGQRRQGLEVRKNFFSGRVTENWNKTPSHVKNVKTVSGFKREVTKITDSWLLLPRGEKIWRQNGGMENNTRKILPERSQWDYWEFINKFPSN
jgi:hypothetical protein